MMVRLSGPTLVGLRLAARAFGGRLYRERIEWIAERYAHVHGWERWAVLLRAAGLDPVLDVADALVPLDARVLDAGCGYGPASHWLARNPERTVLGVDRSPRRIEIAERHASPNLRFRCASIDPLPVDEAPWDAYLFLDVLLLLAPEAQERVLDAAREHASDRAVLLVRDSATEPRWKYRWMCAEERLKTALGYYGRGASRMTIRARSLAEWRALFRRTGWEFDFMGPTVHGLPYPGWFGVARPI